MHHASSDELVVGFYKVGSGRPSLTYHQALDEALCYGWIDGVRRSLDASSYTIRFTPRRKGSAWSQVNLRKAEALIQAGRMMPPGLWALERQVPASYSFEDPKELPPECLARFDAAALAFWESQPYASYRRPAAHWVMSAKRPETREKRLQQLIADCRAGLRIKQLRRA